MKKQNKFLLTAALVASLVGGYAAQADDAYRKQIDEDITKLTTDLGNREKELQKMEEAYKAQKDKYSEEVQKIAEKQ